MHILSLLSKSNLIVPGQKNSIWGALRDLIPFVQFKKREKHPWRSVNFSKVAGFKPSWVFFTFFKLYKWYQTKFTKKVLFSDFCDKLLHRIKLQALSAKMEDLFRLLGKKLLTLRMFVVNTIPPSGLQK